MKDAFGNTLEVGQIVVYAYAMSNSVSFLKREVAGFTPKMVRVRDVGRSGDGSAVKPKSLVILEGVIEI